MPQTSHQKRAAQAVAAWLAAHEKNPTWLVQATGADPGTIGDFLNEKRWPKTGTQGKIESALGWPAGSIRQIANGGPELIWSDTVVQFEPPSTDELMASLLRARAETDSLRDEVRRLAERVDIVESQLYRGSGQEVIDLASASERTWTEPTFDEAMQRHAARDIGRKSSGQQHRDRLDQLGEDNQDAGEDIDPA